MATRKPPRKPKPATVCQDSDRTREARIIGVFGASGAGKTSFVMGEIARDNPSRLLIWDTKGEFAREGYATPVYTVREALEAMRAKRFRIAYKPSLPATVSAGQAAKALREQFGKLCAAAFAVKNLTLIAEELAEVTQPSVAPFGWYKCTAQGRTEGLTVYGLSQHPASVDKHFFGNCSVIRTGRLNFGAHIKSMANVLRVDEAEVIDLKPLQFIQRNMNTGELLRGSLKNQG